MMCLGIIRKVCPQKLAFYIISIPLSAFRCIWHNALSLPCGHYSPIHTSQQLLLYW